MRLGLFKYKPKDKTMKSNLTVTHYEEASKGSNFNAKPKAFTYSGPIHHGIAKGVLTAQGQYMISTTSSFSKSELKELGELLIELSQFAK